MEEISSNLEGSTKDYLNIKNILKNENLDDMLLDMDDEDCKKIKEELNAYKQKREKEIEILENELKKLKDESAKYENLNEEEDDDIILDENLKNQIKEEIIKQIKPKIDEELNKNQLEINKKLENMEKDNINYIDKKFHNLIIPHIQKLKGSIMKNDKNNQNIKEKDEQNKEPELKKEDRIKIKVNVERHPNLSQFNLHSIKGNEIEQNEKDNNKNNISFNLNKKNDNPTKIDPNKFSNINNINNINDMNNHNSIQQKASTNIQKKPTIQNLFAIFNPIFFKNKEQTSINGEKMSEERKEKILLIYFKYRKFSMQNELINYFDNFVRANVLKHLQSNNLHQQIIDNLKYNIKTVLECLEMDKYSYEKYYNSQNYINQKDPKERKKSTEAAFKFRRAFNIGKNIIKDEELIKKLQNNDNDINKVFQLIYG